MQSDAKSIRPLKGFREFLPEPLPNSDVWSMAARNYVFSKWRKTAIQYGFAEFDAPPVEPLDLYRLKSGDEIVEQLYHFETKGEKGSAVALRPEMTPSLARMISDYERGYSKPIKWFSIPQLFRYERQQKGRKREHFQLNVDLFGESGAGADSEVIALLIDTLKSLGLGSDDFVIRLSSRQAWEQFFSSKNPQATSADQYSFFQIIDKLERTDPTESNNKLQAFQLTLDEVQSFIDAANPTEELEEILAQLKARGLSDFVKIDYRIIRGLAYYTGVVFEAFDRKGNHRAIAGGGRYDELVSLISGGKVKIAGLGFGMGDVVLCDLLRERGLMPDFQSESRLDVFALIEDAGLRNETLKLVQSFRNQGLRVEFCLSDLKPQKQFKKALESRANWTTRLEKTETGLDLIWKRMEDRFETRQSLDESVEWNIAFPPVQSQTDL
jgi:histidyl-tRNA synthetase